MPATRLRTHTEVRVVLRHGSDALIVRSGPDEPWDVPGGPLHAGEPVAAAALRWCRLLLDLQPTALGSTRTLVHSYGARAVRYRYVVAELDATHAPPACATAAPELWRWVRIPQLRDYYLAPAFQQALDALFANAAGR